MKPTLYPSIDAFRAAGKDAGKVEGDAAVRASFDTEIKASEDEGSRSVTFTISTESVDRMGDTIDQAGWQLDAYRKNPVVLWAHDSSSLPVAKAPKIWIDKTKLKADAEFTPAGMARFNDTVFDMVKGGFLNATSVGFAPLKYAFVDDPNRKWGIDFMEQELLEFSVVPVPANAEALIEGKAAGIEVDLLLDWAESTFKGLGDAARITKLADDILGADKQSDANLGWARRIAAKAGLGLFPQDRIDSIERAAKAQRLAEKRARDLELIRIRA
jgi:HK97 family phage prohead protease